MREARGGTDLAIFARRLSVVMHCEVPTQVVRRVEEGQEVDWAALGFDGLDLMLAAAEATSRPLSELFDEPAWRRLNSDVDKLYGGLVRQAGLASLSVVLALADAGVVTLAMALDLSPLDPGGTPGHLTWSQDVAMVGAGLGCFLAPANGAPVGHIGEVGLAGRLLAPHSLCGVVFAQLARGVHALHKGALGGSAGLGGGLSRVVLRGVRKASGAGAVFAVFRGKRHPSQHS